ncbi:MAG: hypothetical protein CM15mP74_05150 [Halieaceae bacterium]|nr:MAG: hypothetical protein CM15mP74_05150 [Halieaceae bacterium]
MEAFIKKTPTNPEAANLVKNRRPGCSKHCKAGNPGRLWQVWASGAYGQAQYPVIPPGGGATRALGLRPARVEQTQQLAPYGLPSNRAWDGYPAARERCSPCSLPTPPTPSRRRYPQRLGLLTDQPKGEAWGGVGHPGVQPRAAFCAFSPERCRRLRRQPRAGGL